MNDNEVFECSVCLEENDWGRMKDKDLCIFCYHKLPPDALYSTKRTQIDMCQCGKRWNQWCALNMLADRGGAGEHKLIKK